MNIQRISVIIILMAKVASSSSQLCGDVATKIENTYYKYGYRSTVRNFPTMSSGFCVQELARTERDIYTKIKSHLDPNSSSNAVQVFEYIRDYEESAMVLYPNFESEEYIRAVAGNVVSLYRMVRRFRNFIQPWMTPSKKQTNEELINKLKMIYNVTKGPTRTDLHLAMLAFPLLQFKLDIKAVEIAAGNYSGRETSVKMRAIHCLEIGLHSFVSGFYPIGIEWIEHALEKVKQGDTTVHENLVNHYLERAVAKHDTTWKPFNELGLARTFYGKPLNETGDASERKWQKQVENSSNLDPDWPYQEYNEVCKRKIQRSLKSTSKLYCWHETSIDPYWKIGPLKVELLTPLPDQVIQFHDIVRDKFIQELKNATQGTFRTAILSSMRVNNPKVFNGGAMKKLAESPQVYTKLEKLTLTGLKFTSEVNDNYGTFQFVSYGPGGYQALHLDSTETLATVIIYLEGPEVGGGTGFPILEFSSTALKGSAVIWFNVNSAGEHAKRLPHGSCPVVFGFKWVAIRGIHYAAQDHLMCDKNERAGLDYLRNPTGPQVQERQQIEKVSNAACSQGAIGSLVVAPQNSNNDGILVETSDWLGTSQARKKNYPISVKSLARDRKPTATGLFAATEEGLISLDLQTLDATPLTSVWALAVAVNHKLKQVYWTQVYDNSSILRSKFDGSYKQVIMPPAGDHIYLLAIDETTGNVYFALMRSHEIKVCNALGQNCAVVISNPSLVSFPCCIALDTVKGRGNRQLRSSTDDFVRANLDGSNATIIPAGFNDIQGIALHPTSNDVLYWVDNRENTIGTVHANGGNKRTLIKLKGNPGPCGIQVDSDKIYFSNSKGKRHNIQSVERDSGAKLTTIFNSTEGINHLAIFNVPV